MHAAPGCIRSLPSLPFVQVLLLVQTVGVSYGLGAIGVIVLVQPDFGMPAVNQAWSVCTSAAAGRPVGGIGRVGSCMRARANCALLCDGAVSDAATRSW